MTNEKARALRRAAAFALLLLLALAAPALASSDGVTTYRALLIGNGDYAEVSTAFTNDLPSCANDLNAMKLALTSGTIGYSKLVTKASLKAGDIATAVNSLAGWDADDDDVTVFYYSGHGDTSGLVGTDLNTAGTYNVYGFSLLQSALGNVPGKVIVLLDACRSGSLIAKSTTDEAGFADAAIAAFSAPSGASAKAITSGTKFHVIASSASSQYSWALGSLDGTINYGVATSALCEAMGWAHSGKSSGGTKLSALEGDSSGDGIVTVGEAYTFAYSAAKAMLKGTGVTQDMQIYPSGSAQTLQSRVASGDSDSDTETVAKLEATPMNLSKACIAPGMTLQLDCGLKDAYWSTTSSKIATVDSETGLVKGVAYKYSRGSYQSTTIMALKGAVYATCQVRVMPARYVVSKVRFKHTAINLQQNRGYTMPVRIYPASARYKGLKWSSDNAAVKVSSSGRILSSVSSGTATITATATSGVVATCVVTAVPAQPTSVSLNYKTKTLIPKETFMLTQTVLPAIAGDKSVTWDSTRKSVATVDDTGLVTAVATGRTVISVTTVNGKKAYCVVNVVKNQSIPRTRPKSTAGKVRSSAYRIYYNTTGSLVVDMFFYNRTRYTQTIPEPATGLLVLKLKGATTPLTAKVTVLNQRSLRSGRYTVYTFKLNIEDYPKLAGLKLLGADAWWDAEN